MGGGIVQPQHQQAANAQAAAFPLPQQQQQPVQRQVEDAAAVAVAPAPNQQQIASDIQQAAMDTSSEWFPNVQADEVAQQAFVAEPPQPAVVAHEQQSFSSSAAPASASEPRVASAAARHADVTVHVTPFLEFQEVSASEGKSISCVLTLEASAHEPDERTPIDVVCVIDVSGSMQGTKLDNAKKTLDFVIKQLRPADRMALVTYDSTVTTVFGLTTMSADQKDKCQDECKKLRAGSCTNLSGGLLQGLQILRDLGQQGMQGRAVTSVLLMTDGIANEGITGTNDIVAAMRAAKEGLPTTTVYTFGYGADHNADLLKNISEAGSGMYYYIENVDLIPQCFADCLGGLLTTVAQNITIAIKAASMHTIKKIHSQRPFTISPDGKVATVQMGDIQSEETRDLLFEINLPSCAEPMGAVPIADAEISFLNVVQAKFESKSCHFSVARPQTVGPQEKVAKVEQQKNRIRVADTIEHARRLAERREFDAAQQALQKVVADLEPGSATDPMAKEWVADLRQCAATVTSREQYQAGGSHMMSNMCQAHYFQRSNQPQAAPGRDFVSYTTSVKTRYRDAAM